MAVEHVTEWLQEKKPAASPRYHGVDEDGVHHWELLFPEEDAAEFHLYIPGEVLDNEGMLAERLMELSSQGWLDDAGEQEHQLFLNPLEVAREPGAWE